MKIRTRLTLNFTILVITILVIFGVVTYNFIDQYQENEFYDRILNHAENAGAMYDALHQIDSKLLRDIHNNSKLLPQETIYILNQKKELVYSNKHISIPSVYLSYFKTEKIKSPLKIRNGSKQSIIVSYNTSNGPLYIIASAVDVYGIRQLELLRNLLWIGLIIRIILTAGTGWWVTGRAFSPIKRIREQVESITAQNLNLRLIPDNNKDELTQLANTFNQMLDRLETSFKLQKNFVSNASHELRTPLTVIKGQIEVALFKVRTNEEYQQTLQSLLEEINQLNKLLNGLLTIAQSNLDYEKLKFNTVRLDEVLWQSRNNILKSNPYYQINISIGEFPEDEKLLTINGMEALLKRAFENLMENACKYSNNRSVNIKFNASSSQIRIEFIDQGIGIPEKDLPFIFEPFYRGSNSLKIQGSGLGLALTKKIVEMHEGNIQITSRENEFTNIVLSFNRN